MKHDNKIFRTLVQQHREVEEMLARLQSVDVDEREPSCAQMRTALLSHARAEETTLYAALERAGEMREAKHVKREHREIEDALRELEALDYTDVRWSNALGKLTDAVEHHVEEEESVAFDSAAASMDESELDALADRFLAQQEQEKARLADEDDYDDRSKDELMELARAHAIAGRSTMTKQQLIAALRTNG